MKFAAAPLGPPVSQLSCTHCPMQQSSHSLPFFGQPERNSEHSDSKFGPNGEERRLKTCMKIGTIKTVFWE